MEEHTHRDIVWILQGVGAHNSGIEAINSFVERLFLSSPNAINHGTPHFSPHASMRVGRMAAETKGCPSPYHLG